MSQVPEVKLSVQVTPAPSEELLKDLSNLRYAVVPDEDGEDYPCDICDQGRKPFKHPCRVCKGTGLLHGVLSARFDAFNREEDFQRLRELRNSHNVSVRLVLAEFGTAQASKGHARIICGFKGEKMYGYFQQGVFVDYHAVFYVKAALVIDYKHKHQVGEGIVSLYRLDEDALSFNHHELWHFNDEVVRNEVEPAQITNDPSLIRIRFPYDAAKAAFNKSRTYHCRNVYYALKKFHND